MKRYSFANTKKEIRRIACAYKRAKDDLPSITQEQRIQMRDIVSDMFGHVSRYTHFDFVKTDPYKYDNIKEVQEDFHKGFIKVNVSGNKSTLWGPVYNLMFRAIHDYIHVKYDLDFNYKAEREACLQQTKDSKIGCQLTPWDEPLDWDLYAKILRSEIIYQAAYKTYFGEFHVPVQKIILQDL